MNSSASGTATAAPPREESAAEEWTRRTRRELVGRVVQAPAFQRSERLATLLTYVCEMSLKGRDAELNEQRIGHAVFGRARDYDSSIDGIVRTQASRLRQRLQQHFQEEGAGEPVRIEIPKGGYVPVFVTQSVGAAEETAAVERGDEETVEEGRPREWSTMLPWALCSVLLACVAALAIRRHGDGMTSAPAHPLWSRVFVPGKPTLEVPGDSGLVISYRFTEQGVSLSDYLAGRYRMLDNRHAAAQADAGQPSLQLDLTNRRYTSIVDLDVAVELQHIADQQHGSMLVRYARDVRPNDLKNGNIVLVGAFEGNPWLELFERNMNFALVNDYKTRVFAVVNRAPKPGEPAQWTSDAADPQRRVYGVIALRPNLSGNGNVLIVEGTSMAGVESAWDFVSDDAELLPFLRKIARADGSVPNFELLLGSQNIGVSSVRSEQVAWRTSP